MKRTFVILLACGAVVGCSNSGPTDPAPRVEAPSGPAADAAALRLAAEPAGAAGVLAVRKDAKDGDDVVIVGRIGGSHKPFTGKASFTIVDPSLKPCSENGEDDNCSTPWDYCCGCTPEQLKDATALVKFTDPAGDTYHDDAKALFGLKELQTVVVRGKLKRDAAGNLTVVASGLFVRS